MKSKYHVRQADVKPYPPANHTGTRNFRLIVIGERAKLLAIYVPPCLERPENVRR